VKDRIGRGFGSDPIATLIAGSDGKALVDRRC
jgi:hypothetical protein